MMMLDGNTAALRQHETEQERREKFQVSLDEARKDLVEIIMDGKSFSPNGKSGLNLDLYTILSESLDISDLTDMILGALFSRGDAYAGMDHLEETCKYFVNRYLEINTQWVETRADQMSEEREEEARDRE